MKGGVIKKSFIWKLHFCVALYETSLYEFPCIIPTKISFKSPKIILGGLQTVKFDKALPMLSLKIFSVAVKLQCAKGRIVDFVLIWENTGQRKPVFRNTLLSAKFCENKLIS